MSHSRARSLFLAGALVAAALVPAAAAGAAPPSKADVARAEHDRIVSYWTPERMRAAKPRDFERLPDGSFSLAPRPARGKSGGSGGGTGGGGTTAVTGATWSLNGTPVNEATGKVYFQFTDTDGWICSGTVIVDGGVSTQSLVLTAGHCAYDQKTGSFAKNWMFIPDFDERPTYDCPSTEYGCWTAKALVAHEGFTTEAAFTTRATLHDFAVAVVGPGGKAGVKEDLDAAVGSAYGLKFSQEADLSGGKVASAFGYPAAKKYNGSVLTYCSGPTTTDPYNGGLTWGLACDMTGGSSGGPWFDSSLDLRSGTSGAVVSLNSYGYQGQNYMFGPRFNSETRAVYDAALGGTAAGGAVIHALP